MEEFYPLLVVAILWLCIGLPISKAAQAKRRSAAGRPAAAPRSAQAPAQEKPQASVRMPAPQESRLMPALSVTRNDDSVYQGSLNAFTGEGYDPCHEEDLTGLNRAEASAPAHPAADRASLPFGWTGNDIVRGIVVSEILNRRKTFRAS